MPFSTRPRTGDIVFVTGYKTENIDRRQGKAITDPQTHRSELLSDCNPPFLCDLGRGTPPGHSGAPVIDRSGKLVGILKGGNNLESSFEPILPVREALEPYCESFLTDNYQKYCLAKIRGEREQKGPFDKAGRILCDGARQPDASAQYRAKEGFEIAGFVTHEDTTDDTGNGWVGHAEYTLSDDGKHVVEVNVRMGCTAYGQAGWAETRIYGNIKKILDKKDQESIKKECVAERGVQ